MIFKVKFNVYFMSNVKLLNQNYISLISELVVAIIIIFIEFERDIKQ